VKVAAYASGSAFAVAIAVVSLKYLFCLFLKNKTFLGKNKKIIQDWKKLQEKQIETIRKVAFRQFKKKKQKNLHAHNAKKCFFDFF
jgi:hypothetical protein